jgi:hypothetical protein
LPSGVRVQSRKRAAGCPPSKRSRFSGVLPTQKRDPEGKPVVMGVSAAVTMKFFSAAGSTSSTTRAPKSSCMNPQPSQLPAPSRAPKAPVARMPPPRLRCSMSALRSSALSAGADGTTMTDCPALAISAGLETSRKARLCSFRYSRQCLSRTSWLPETFEKKVRVVGEAYSMIGVSLSTNAFTTEPSVFSLALKPAMPNMPCA